MQVRPDFRRAIADTSAVIVAIQDDQLVSPTPSPNYTVGDLVEHVDELHHPSVTWFPEPQPQSTRRSRQRRHVRERVIDRAGLRCEAGSQASRTP